MSKPIKAVCRECGKKRIIYPDSHKYHTGLCATCYHHRSQPKAEKSPQWKGGRKVSGGYISIYLKPDDPLFPMTNGWDNYVLEHRLVMARELGRYLDSNEEVHHLNGIRDDNRKENLALVSKKDHPRQTLLHKLQGRIRELESGKVYGELKEVQ